MRNDAPAVRSAHIGVVRWAGVARDAAEPDIKARGPRRRERFLAGNVGFPIRRNLAGLALAILAAYFGSLELGHDVTSARTAAFATWLLSHIVLILTLLAAPIAPRSRPRRA